MREKLKIEAALKKYLPEGYEAVIAQKIVQHPIRFKITKPRKSKLGDFRPGINGAPHQITVNGNLNKYQFLITTLHEFAHLYTHINYGSNIKPHGKEWKKAFNELLEPLKSDDKLPGELRAVLQKNQCQIKASSCNDTALYRVLKKFDKKNEDETLLEDLQNNQAFILGKRVFVRGILKRTRYLCREVGTNRQYLINRLALVRPFEKELNEK